IGFNSNRVSENEFNDISRIVFEIESIIKFVKNAAIGMSVSINFLIESSDLIIKDTKVKELIENDDLFDIMVYSDKIRSHPEIIVPFRSNIHTINQDNWYTSERIFNTESSTVVNREINALYDEIKKVNHIYDNISEPINLNNAKPIFDNLWDLYIREQGIINELSRLAAKTEDLSNDRYLKIAFTKAKLELYENNLIFDVEKQLFIEDMLSHKIWLLKIFAAQSDIYKSLLKHKNLANSLTDKLEKLFTNSRYGLETLTKFIYEWYQNKEKNLDKILNLDPITDNVKVKFIGETISNFNSFVNMKKISENSLYNEWMPKSIFTRFVSRNMINSLIDLVPIVNYEKDDDALEYNDKFISPYTEIEKEKQKLASDNEFNGIIKKYENTIEDLKQQLKNKNKVDSFSNDIRYISFELNKPEINEKEIDKIINANIYEPINNEFVEFITANEVPLSDEELSLLVYDEPETIYDTNDSIPYEEQIIFFGEAPEDGIVLEIREIDGDITQTQSESSNFENEEINIIYSDKINDDNINYEKVSVANNEWDESLKEVLEEISIDNYDEIETKFEPVIIESNYADEY
ncbi:MAG: hypothetical protein K2L64_01235, partial [Ureaplasma sp.]|nr:hypothetical protein [Ureaplasma sp.]